MNNFHGLWDSEASMFTIGVAVRDDGVHWMRPDENRVVKPATYWQVIKNSDPIDIIRANSLPPWTCYWQTKIIYKLYEAILHRFFIYFLTSGFLRGLPQS